MILILFACKFESMYEKAIDIPHGEWNKKQNILFEIPVTDTLNGYDILLNIRNTNDYPYSNLFVFVTLSAPNGQNKVDTLELTLADDKGKWLGHGYTGIWNNEKMYRKQVRFSHSGTYRLSVQQGMRDDVLRGIPDVGIRIERTE